jgi:hypothetical protein
MGIEGFPTEKTDVPTPGSKDFSYNMLMFLGRTEAKLDAALSWIKAHEDETQQMNRRISALESWKAWLLGAAAVTTAGMTTLFALGLAALKGEIQL